MLYLRSTLAFFFPQNLYLYAFHFAKENTFQ